MIYDCLVKTDNGVEHLKVSGKSGANALKICIDTYNGYKREGYVKTFEVVKIW